MEEKFSIIKELDVRSLNDKIAYFAYPNGHDPYIFANSETLAVLVRSVGQDLNFTSFDGKQTKFKGLVAKYKGCKVFKDNTLAFGEIELR